MIAVVGTTRSAAISTIPLGRTLANASGGPGAAGIRVAITLITRAVCRTHEHYGAIVARVARVAGTSTIARVADAVSIASTWAGLLST